MEKLHHLLRSLCCGWKFGKEHDEKSSAPLKFGSIAEYQSTSVNPRARGLATSTTITPTPVVTSAPNAQATPISSISSGFTVLDPQEAEKTISASTRVTRGKEKDDLELWKDLLKDMNPAEWEVMGQDLGYYGDKDGLASEIREEFGLTLVKNSKVVQNRASSSTVCWCMEGVFTFGLQFESCCLISRSIANAHKYLKTPGLQAEGPVRSSGRPYFGT